jgi:hypothetical protein
MLIHVQPMSQAAFLHGQKEIFYRKFSSFWRKFKIVIIKTFTAMRATFSGKSLFLAELFFLVHVQIVSAQIISAQFVSAQIVSAQIASGTNCIGIKLYREHIVSGTNCIGNKLYRLPFIFLPFQ